MGITIYPVYGSGGSGATGGSSVALDGPVSLYVNQSAQLAITDFDAYSEYAVTASAGTVAIAGDAIDYTAPAMPGEITITITVNGVARVVALDIRPADIATPTNISPAAGETNIGRAPTLTGSAMVALGGSDTHAASRWRVYQGATLVHDSDWSASALVSYPVPAGVLSVNASYTWAVEHRGVFLGDSAPSSPTDFVTAAFFFNPYTAAPGTPRAGGFFVGVMTYSDGDYELIDAGKSSETRLTLKTTNTVTSGTYSDGDGLANSTAMNSDGHPAAQYCLTYAGGGQDDWYLPARDEQELRYRRLKPSVYGNSTGARDGGGNVGDNANSNPPGASYTAGVPGQTESTAFRAGGAEALNSPWEYYWTSTQYAPTAGRCWVQNYTDGRQENYYLGSLFWVRPVRRLKI